MAGVTPTLESDRCPPIAAFCELAVRLYTPNLRNLGAKSAIVSGLHLKYSCFLETRARDRARSAHCVVRTAVDSGLAAADIVGIRVDNWEGSQHTSNCVRPCIP